MVQGLGFMVQGLEFMVQGLGFMVQGLGFMVQGLGLSTRRRQQAAWAHQVTGDSNVPEFRV